MVTASNGDSLTAIMSVDIVFRFLGRCFFVSENFLAGESNAFFVDVGTEVLNFLLSYIYYFGTKGGGLLL